MEERDKKIQEKILRKEDYIILDGIDKVAQYPELIKEVLEKYWGKTSAAPSEIIAVSAALLDDKELYSVLEALRQLLITKVVKSTIMTDQVMNKSTIN